MACFYSLSPMRAVTDFSCESTVSPIVVSHTSQLVPPGDNSERSSLLNHCLSCRWRKKKCKPTEAITPSPFYPCVDCAKFNIRCDGSGLDRPPVSNRLLQRIRHISSKAVSFRVVTAPKQSAGP